MDLQELQMAYQIKRQQLEEQEEELCRAISQGERLIEEADYQLRCILNGLAVDEEPLSMARREYAVAFEHFKDKILSERQQIFQKLETLDQDYYKEYQQIKDEGNK